MTIVWAIVIILGIVDVFRLTALNRASQDEKEGRVAIYLLPLVLLEKIDMGWIYALFLLLAVLPVLGFSDLSNAIWIPVFIVGGLIAIGFNGAIAMLFPMANIALGLGTALFAALYGVSAITPLVEWTVGWLADEALGSVGWWVPAAVQVGVLLVSAAALVSEFDLWPT